MVQATYQYLWRVPPSTCATYPNSHISVLLAHDVLEYPSCAPPNTLYTRSGPSNTYCFGAKSRDNDLKYTLAPVNIHESDDLT